MLVAARRLILPSCCRRHASLVPRSRTTRAPAAANFSTRPALPEATPLPPLCESYSRTFSQGQAQHDEDHGASGSSPKGLGMIMTEGAIRNEELKNHHPHHQWNHLNKLQQDSRFEWAAPLAQADEHFGAPPSSDGSTSSASSNATVEDPNVPRTSVLMTLTDRVGILHDVLRWFWKFDVNICRIESRPVSVGGTGPGTFDFFVDLEGSPARNAKVAQLLDALQTMTDKLLILDEKQVHWFPRHISELDLICHRTLDAGVDLIAADHPGFSDVVYRQRRAHLTQTALAHSWNEPIPRIDYTNDEVRVWTAVWDRMQPLWQRYACREYLQALDLLQRHCGYQRDAIPQQEDISQFLKQRTGFTMRPVAGLLSSRDFLNGLAFRVFFSTQYIRHSSRPLYTPEPDICHELLGHAPMLADRSFADFSQEIGLASLGASDDDIDRLAHCYWHSVEFGLCQEEEESSDKSATPQRKAYGAGLLSSFGELEYACGTPKTSTEEGKDDDLKQPSAPEIKPWDPEVAARQAFPITTYQPVYFLAESLEDAKQRMRTFCEALPRPFFALHNAQTNTIHIDRPVVRTKGVPETAHKDDDAPEPPTAATA